MDTSQAYQILHLHPDATFQDIKYKYRKMALESHPDRNREQDGTKFKMITEAYHLLKNNNKVSNAKTRTYKQAGPKKDAKTVWGARPDDPTPEEDWSRYTKQVEESNPTFWKNYVAEFWKTYEENIRQPKKPYDFVIIQEDEPDLSVDVDRSRCIGCCSCETIAPTVFSVDKASKLNPKSSVIDRKGAKCEKIMDAAQTCPTKAINVEDLESGKKIYPY